MFQLLLVAFILLAAFLTIGLYLAVIQELNRSRQRYAPAPKTRVPLPNLSSLGSRHNAAIEQKLIQLCQSDRKVALRLVDSVRQQNPGRSDQWVWEKAVCDLERDRY